MQDAFDIEREALRRLPAILTDVLGEERVDIERPNNPNDRFDLWSPLANRDWHFVIKSSGRPGVVDAAAREMTQPVDSNTVFVLVVPDMTPAGVKAAAAHELNWIDLAGNAWIREPGVVVNIRGNPPAFTSPGRPSSAFAPRSSRVARLLLLDPLKWWLQKELVEESNLNSGNISRIVGRLVKDELLEHDGSRIRPRNPDVLLDAWADKYKFDRHDIVTGHVSGEGSELSHELTRRLETEKVRHAFTGLPAAWHLDPFVRFRLNSVYVEGDPHTVAEAIGVRSVDGGANVQVIGPDDEGVFAGVSIRGGLPVVAPVQVYLDLLDLPERAAEAAENLRRNALPWGNSRE